MCRRRRNLPCAPRALNIQLAVTCQRLGPTLATINGAKSLDETHAALAVFTNRWWIALPVLIGARLAYHVYYGWPVFGLAIWAAVAAAIVWRWRSPRVVIGFVVAHIAWDSAVALPALRGSFWFFFAIWCVIPLLVLAGTIRMIRRTHGLAPIVGYTTGEWTTRHRTVG